MVDWLLAPFRWLREGTALHRTLSIGYLRQRHTRTLLIIASIALGVAALVATRALNANLNKAARSVANPLSHHADLIVSNGQSGIPASVVEKLDRAKADGYGIRHVQPITLGRILIPELGNRSVLLIGARLPQLPGPVSPDLTKPMVNEDLGVRVDWRPQELGRVLVNRGQLTPVVLSSGLADDLDARGDTAGTFQLRLAEGSKRAVCIGKATPTSPEDRLERNVVFLSTEDAAPLIYPNRRDFVTQVYLQLESPKDALAVRDRLRKLLGEHPYNVQTQDDNFEAVKDVAAGLELGVAIGGAGALVIGLFLVYNALSVSVAERRHDIGILRSVGATRGQIAGLFVGEAALLGLFGSLLGLPLGYGLAWLALGPLSRMLGDVFAPMEAPPIVVSWATLAIAVAAGVATTIFAALVPAVQAALEEPADAVRRVPVALHLFYRLLQAIGAALLLGTGFLCVAARTYLPLRFGVFAGIILVLVGTLVATPLLAAFLSRLLQPFFRRLFGLEGRLAADNLARAPGRTGLVIAALAATGALMVQTAGLIRSSEDAVIRWLDEDVAADLFVTAGASMTEKSSEAVPVSEDLVRDLKAIPGVEAALPVRVHYLEYQSRYILLIALDADAFREAGSTHSLARNLERFPELREPGNALVSHNFAALNGIKIGDRVTIDGPDGTLEVKVIGTVLDYTWNRGTILVNRAWYREQYRDTQVNFFDIYLKKGADREAVMDAIQVRLGGTEAVHVIHRDALREALSATLRRIYAIAYAQQAVVGLVALLGVTSAMFISVLQRRRELGLLRAVGATRRQVLRSVLAEAFQMGVIGGLLGFGVGLLLEWYVIDILLLDESGFTFPLVVPWVAASVVFGTSVLGASLVGLGPAWHATRIRIAEAIAYE